MLYLDTPGGVGFSTPSTTTTTIDDNTVSVFLLESNRIECLQTIKQLILALKSFYSIHSKFESLKLFLAGEGAAASLAVGLATALKNEDVSFHVQGLIFSNGRLSERHQFNAGIASKYARGFIGKR